MIRPVLIIALLQTLIASTAISQGVPDRGRTAFRPGILLGSPFQVQAELSSSPGCSGPAFSYNVVCYGADPTGSKDSAKAIQKALDTAAGSPIEIPAGKYLLTTPLVVEAGNDSPGPKIAGAGQDVAFLEPCFVGHHPPPAAGAVIVVDGSRSKGTNYPYKFAYGGYIRGLTIDGEIARRTHPSLNCPEAASADLDGIEITSWWQAEIEDVHIENMGRDAIDFPWRHDLRSADCNSPDCFASAHDEIKHVRLLHNLGWGVDAGVGIGYTSDGVTESIIEQNASGGIYLFGWQNWIINNAIAFNGCSPVADRHSTQQCQRSQPGGTSSPQPGGGVLLARFNPEADAPQIWHSLLGARIERNEFDSNYGYDIWQQAGDNAQIVGNRFINHATGVWFTGAQGNYPHCQVVLGYGSAGSHYTVRNTYLRNNLSRSDSRQHDETDYATQMYCIDPAGVAQSQEELETTFGPNSYNFTPLVAGGGAAAICAQSGGRVTGCTVQVGGWYPARTTPTVKLVGPGCSGQSARVQMAQQKEGGTWGWVTSIEIEDGGGGCTGDVWPIFGTIPYPAVNRMHNSFRGYKPATAANPTATYGPFTSPEER